MHLLSLRFHLERQDRGLTRVLERGRNGIETIVRMVIVQAVPTVVELAAHRRGPALPVRLALRRDRPGTVGLYMWYTYVATEWRIGIRRRMNESDSDANTKAIDSLLITRPSSISAPSRTRLGVTTAPWRATRNASVKAYTSLAVLNAGQAAIFTIGLTVAMGMCASRSGRQQDGRDFVMINAMMIQLYQPLNFMAWSIARSSRR